MQPAVLAIGLCFVSMTTQACRFVIGCDMCLQEEQEAEAKRQAADARAAEAKRKLADIERQKQEDKARMRQEIAERKKDRDAERMHPVDAPPGSLRQLLCKAVCCIEEHTKRTVSELLLELCDGEMNEFTIRAGYGNAVFMHHVLGAVQIGESTIDAARRG